ncbi:MAG: MBL fold metallo-hydrolase [Solirubrobacterales bacterium]
MKLQLIRNATIKINYLKGCFLTDPYLADQFSRPPYIGKSKTPMTVLPFSKAEIMSGVEMVLLSHIHSDHFDEAAKETIDKDMLILCQKEDETEIKTLGFKNIKSVDNSILWKNINITKTYAKHGTGSVLEDMGPGSGYILRAQGEPTVYLAGDTILCDEVKAVLVKEKPDIIITHSCGAEWGDHVKIVMDEKDTIEICKMLPNSTVVAVHMETVDHATVTRDELRQYARENNIKDTQLLIPFDGEIIDL